MPCLTMKKFSRPLHHPFDVGGVVLRPVAGALLADVAVVDPHLVAHLAAEQLVDRHARRLAGDVPERMLDGADGGAVGLERAALADLQHHALDVGRVLADQRLAEMQHPGLEIGLGVLDFAKAVEAFVGDDADDGVLADDGAAQIGDLHVPFVGSRCLSRQRASAPGAIPGILVVPVVRRLPDAGDARLQMLRRSPRRRRRRCPGPACPER